MSYTAIDTRNRIGVRQAYSSRARGMGVHRAPAETPPISSLFSTRPLSGVKDFNTTSAAHALLGLGMPTPMITNNVRMARIGPIVEGPISASGPQPGYAPYPVAVAPEPVTTPIAVAAPVSSTQPTTQPNPWQQRGGGGGPSSWQRNQAYGGWSTSAVPSSPGGAPSYASPPAEGTVAQAGTPVPFNWPIAQPYTDTNGNVWTYNAASGWSITSAVPTTAQQRTVTPSTYPIGYGPYGVALSPGGPSAVTGQAGTPVPVGYPTNEPYTDSNGNTWTYSTTAGWQITSTSSSQAALLAEEQSAAAAAATGTTTAAGTTSVSVSSGTSWSDLTTWLQESTIISGLPNFFLVAGVGVVGLLIFTRGKK